MSEPIVIVGRAGATSLLGFGFVSDFFSVGFGAYYVAFGLTTIGNAMGTDRRAIRVPKNGDKPEVTTEGTSAQEAATVLQALDNVERHSGLSSVFADAAARDVKLHIKVVNTAPSSFESSQVGGISFSAVDTQTMMVEPTTLKPGLQ